LALRHGGVMPAWPRMQKKSFFQRNWYYFTPAVIVAIPLIMGAFSMANWGYSFKESMTALLHFGSTDTRYAFHFTEEKFRNIRPGMDARTVGERLKNPMEGQLGLVWKYSLPNEGAPYYHERTIVFEKDAQNTPRVKEVIRRLYTPEMSKK
jgi:hypothetical protein